ncbi:MAG: hypothetical protein FWG73_04430 [Planctomycetaceae bacterium]|nr:hypothetical protein [Planctomycetaceae bacterium]
MKKISTSLLAVLACLCLTGCALKDMFTRKDNPPPQPWTTSQTPTLEQITASVNRNSQLIRNFSTENASVYAPGINLPLHSRITFEKPKRLRIQGSATSLGSREFDFGSNDDIFWLWMRRNHGEMWFCRHDQYPISPVRSTIPLDPNWLVEALGIVEFKPTDLHLGPTRLEDGNWEIVSYCQTPSGQFIKRTVVDHKVGWVIRQGLYTPQDELIALAHATDLRFDRASGIYYVKRVEVQCHGMEGKMVIDLGTPSFNRSEPFAVSMFAMPTYEGYRAVDLCGPEILQQHGRVMPP